MPDKTKRQPKTFKAYILRTCDEDMSSFGGFVWPESGHVAAPDWSDVKVCGQGLHGFLWGEGDGGLASFEPDAKWIVAGINEWVDLGGKVKFPEAWVVHCGDRMSATEFIRQMGARGAVVGGTATAGDGGTATAGDGGTATAGVGGIIIVRYYDGNRYRIVEGYVGEGGIEPNVAYRVNGCKLVKVS